MGGQTSKQQQSRLSPMDHRRRALIEIVQMNRREFRSLFGIEFANQCGYFVDRYLSAKVHSFCDWLDYPEGHRILRSKDVCSVIVSSDGYSLLTGSDGGRIMEWDMLNFHPIRKWSAHDSSVVCLAHYSDTLVSGSRDGSVKVWDSSDTDYHLKHTLDGHSDCVNCVDINHEGIMIISCSSDMSLRVWSVDTGKLIQLLRGHSRSVKSSHFIGDRIVSASDDRSIMIWDPCQKDAIETHTKGINSDINTVKVNCDGSRLVCMFVGGFRLYSLANMTVLSFVIGGGTLSEFHPCLPHILAIAKWNTLKIVTINGSGCTVCSMLDGHRKMIKDIAFSPCGSRLISVAFDQSVKIWDISNLF